MADCLPLGTGPRGVVAATEDSRNGELTPVFPFVAGGPLGEDRTNRGDELAGSLPF